MTPPARSSRSNMPRPRLLARTHAARPAFDPCSAYMLAGPGAHRNVTACPRHRADRHDQYGRWHSVMPMRARPLNESWNRSRGMGQSSLVRMITASDCYRFGHGPISLDTTHPFILVCNIEPAVRDQNVTLVLC